METCFGPRTQGIGTKTHLESRFCANFVFIHVCPTGPSCFLSFLRFRLMWPEKRAGDTGSIYLPPYKPYGGMIQVKV